ncbi:ATP-binding domain-containing protein [Vibrio phage F23s1]|nr:ATP-binding domain-containing protein [Vibrio phage F23s1]
MNELNKLRSLADRISIGQLKERRGEFPEILRKLAEAGDDVSAYMKPRFHPRVNKMRTRGIPQLHRRSTFSSFEANGSLAGKRDMVRAYAENFTEMFEEGTDLVLIGGNGTGKTHLASALGLTLGVRTCMIAEARSLYKELSEDDQRYFELFGDVIPPFKFVNIERVMQGLMSAFDAKVNHWDNGEEFRAKEEEFQNLVELNGLLILDEYAATKVNPMCLNFLNRLATYRYDNRLPTCVITNRTEEELREYDSTAASRFLSSDGLVIRFDEGDYRAKGR